MKFGKYRFESPNKIFKINVYNFIKNNAKDS